MSLSIRPEQPMTPVPVKTARWSPSRLLVMALLVMGSLGCEEATLKPVAPELTASVAPWGGTAFTDDVLTGGGELRHPRGVALTGVVWSWSWKLDGNPTSIITQRILPASTVKHQVWEVTVSADYGGGTAGPKTAEIRIINSPPIVTVADTTQAATRVPAILPRQLLANQGPPYLGDVLTIESPWTDADNDAVTLSYAWTVGGRRIVVDPSTDTLDTSVPVLVEMPSGQTLRPFALNDLIRVSITPNDGEEDGKAANTAAVKLKQRSSSATAPGPAPASARAAGPRTSVRAGSAAAPRTLAVLPPPAPLPVPLGVSELNACHIGPDGSLACSGIEDFGLTQPPDGSFVQVAVQPDYGCAIRAEDGTVACWGAPVEDLGQLSAPEGPFNQIDLGVATACGLRPSGEIVCWGDDSLGQSSPPEGEFVFIDVSDSYGCAMDARGVSTCWGELE